MKDNKTLIILLILFSYSLLLIVGCSVNKEYTEEGRYVLVYEKDDKAFWFNPDSVKLFEESVEKIYIEAMVYIEHKASHPFPMKEYALWYFHPKEKKYKPTSVYFYDYDDVILEE